MSQEFVSDESCQNPLDSEPSRPLAPCWTIPISFTGLASFTGDALHHLADPVVVGGGRLITGLVDRGQGGAVEADGGHRVVAFFN